MVGSWWSSWGTWWGEVVLWESTDGDGDSQTVESGDNSNGQSGGTVVQVYWQGLGLWGQLGVEY